VGASERIVRHLRLRADSQAGVRRAALKLEDALRCASLPDAGARVLLVRRLELGLIAAGASPQTLSLLLEQRVAAVGGTWVHGADPNADRADFVFFRDALEARCELALRLADAASCTAWFWPLAVPEFKAGEGARLNLRRIALTIAALPEAPAALPAWVARLTAAGVAPVLAQAIGHVEAAALLRAAGPSASAPRLRGMHTAMPRQPPLASGARDVGPAVLIPHRVLEPAFTVLPLWAQTLALAGGFVPQAAGAAPVVHAAQAGRADAPDQTGVESTRQMHLDVEAASTRAGPDTAAKDGRERPAPRRIKGDTANAPDPPHSNGAEAASDPSPTARPIPDAVPSAYGGLLFLVPVLQRLGYTAWAETLPDGAAGQVMQQLLALVLRHLEAPSDDPAWLFATTSPGDDFGDIDAKAPAIWSDPGLAAPRGSTVKDIAALAQQARPAASHARVWLIACRRWLRRIAGIGVASLVARPAAIGLTATHADVFFRLSDADMRVRRAGLDLDPGWNPWLGRVIGFHYAYVSDA